ncbi:MAG: HAD-IIB family hydrolase [Bryobacteraceae bacterium]|nr:HAD-IIB family hydrolase [Bryobacteraceae bacterium]
MILIFSDLDGTLLDKDTYSWQAARPALDRVRKLGIPLVLVSSKTRAEMEHWRAQIGNQDPFIVENGGAAYVPHEDGYRTLEWGTPYAMLCAALRAVESDCGCRLVGFHELTAAEIAELTELTLEQAEMARRREYDEPFLAGGVCDPQKLEAAVAKLGLRYSWGGRFPHLHGNNDKAVAAAALIDLFRQRDSGVTTIGLGDAPNDLPLLRLVDQPVIIRSPHSAEMFQQLPNAMVTTQPGPAGWNRAVLELLDQS